MGRFTVLRQTQRKRLQAKLSAVESRAPAAPARPDPEGGRVAAVGLLGHLQYYGVPMNLPALFTFCFQVGRLWYRAWRGVVTPGDPPGRMRRLIERWAAPSAHYSSLSPEATWRCHHKARAQCGNPDAGIRGGGYGQPSSHSNADGAPRQPLALPESAEHERRAPRRGWSRPARSPPAPAPRRVGVR